MTFPLAFLSWIAFLVLLCPFAFSWLVVGYSLSLIACGFRHCWKFFVGASLSCDAGSDGHHLCVVLCLMFNFWDHQCWEFWTSNMFRKGSSMKEFFPFRGIGVTMQCWISEGEFCSLRQVRWCISKSFSSMTINSLTWGQHLLVAFAISRPTFCGYHLVSLSFRFAFSMHSSKGGGLL